MAGLVGFALGFDDFHVCGYTNIKCLRGRTNLNPPGKGVFGLMFAGYVPLASQSPYPNIVYFLANYRPHLSYFLENVIYAIPTYL